MKKILVLFATVLLLFSCKTIYVPIKGETITRDSLVIETRIDTLKVQLPPERVRDWTGLLDTLRLETGLATSTTWVDTTRGILAGELKNKETPVEVAVPSTHTLERKDSIIYKEIPYRVEITKEKKIYPLWMIILSCLGIASTLVLGFSTYLKVKKKLI
jgi:hypothetical protein